MSSAPRGLALREGLELELMQMGRVGPPLEPRRRPQAGKSGDPRSQNADSSPRAQGALGLGLAAKPKGKCGAPRAPTACCLGRRVAVDWTWASPLPHAASATARLTEGWPGLGLPSLLSFALLQIPFLALALLLLESPDLPHSSSSSERWRPARPRPRLHRLGTRRPWIHQT